MRNLGIFKIHVEHLKRDFEDNFTKRSFCIFRHKIEYQTKLTNVSALALTQLYLSFVSVFHSTLFQIYLSHATCLSMF